MVRGGHKDIFFRFLQGLAPAVVIDPPVQKIHDIDGVFVHPVEQYSGRIRYDADGDLRVQPVVFRPERSGKMEAQMDSMVPRQSLPLSVEGSETAFFACSRSLRMETAY